MVGCQFVENERLSIVGYQLVGCQFVEKDRLSIVGYQLVGCQFVEKDRLSIVGCQFVENWPGYQFVGVVKLSLKIRRLSIICPPKTVFIFAMQNFCLKKENPF